MQKGLAGYTGMLLAAFALAGCESAEDQEIRVLIDEIASLQEQTITAMEASARAKDEEARVRVVGDESWPAEVLASVRADAARNAEREAAQRVERLEARRKGHENLLAKLREALESGDWTAAFPMASGLKLSALEIVRVERADAARVMRTAEAARDLDMAWRERAAERSARIRAQTEQRSEAMKRLPDPSAWSR